MNSWSKSTLIAVIALLSVMPRCMAADECNSTDPYCVNFGPANAVIKSQPTQDREALTKIYSSLTKLSIDDLSQLKAMDSCDEQKTIDCRGISYSKIKTLIDIALYQISASETKKDTQLSRYISISSGVISLCSLIISFVSLGRKRSSAGLQT